MNDSALVAARAPVDLRARWLLAILIASICALYTWYQHSYFMAQRVAPDSLFLWRAANLLLAGGDPWSADVWAHGAASASATADVAWQVTLHDPLYYPMPAVVLWLPLALLPFLVASTLFNTVGAFLFVMAVTRDGLLRAWVCGSVPFMIAMRFGQWSPMISAAWVYPMLAGVLVAKPNLGLPVFLARPGWRAAALCSAMLVLPTVAAPWWVSGWLHNVSSEMGRVTPHPAPVTLFSGAGVLLLLVVLRWRRPEARLFLVLACLPQLPYWADQLPLMLVPHTRREVLGMLLVTLVGFSCWMAFAPAKGDFVDTIRPVAVLCTYLPALVVILRRSNTGQTTAWLEKWLVSRLPTFLRGTSA